MQDLKIYGLNVGAVLFSAVNEINPILQTFVLILSLVYTALEYINKSINNMKKRPNTLLRCSWNIPNGYSITTLPSKQFYTSRQ